MPISQGLNDSMVGESLEHLKQITKFFFCSEYAMY